LNWFSEFLFFLCYFVSFLISRFLELASDCRLRARAYYYSLAACRQKFHVNLIADHRHPRIANFSRRKSGAISSPREHSNHGFGTRSGKLSKLARAGAIREAS
jgi:hypothetical protein